MSDEHLETKPTIETVLERINELGSKVETRMAALETIVTDLRDEVHHGFRKLERRFEVLSGDMLKLRTDLGYIQDQLDKLENAS